MAISIRRSIRFFTTPGGARPARPDCLEWAGAAGLAPGAAGHGLPTGMWQDNHRHGASRSKGSTEP
ncbi:MAG: hypothetical protein LW862_21420 [Rubrivivax sp.]|nr:hypothetical protein [Rubrivivax sp.]